MAFSGLRNGCLTVDGGPTYDSFVAYRRNGADKYIAGIDPSNGNQFALAYGNTLGTNDYWRMTIAGQRTMPSQPCFSAAINYIANVAGDGTTYYIGDVVAVTTVESRGGGFYPGPAGPAIYTAPKSGIYEITYGITVSSEWRPVYAPDNIVLSIITTGYTFEVYRNIQMGTAYYPGGSSWWTGPCMGDRTFSGSVVTQLAAGDTVRFSLYELPHAGSTKAAVISFGYISAMLVA